MKFFFINNRFLNDLESGQRYVIYSIIFGFQLILVFMYKFYFFKLIY